jgi:hypothetical protein
MRFFYRFDVLIESTLIPEDSDDKSGKSDDESYARERKIVEEEIGLSLEIFLYIDDSYAIEYDFENSNNPKNRLMDPIDQDEKNNIGERKKRHVKSIEKCLLKARLS